MLDTKECCIQTSGQIPHLGKTPAGISCLLTADKQEVFTGWFSISKSAHAELQRSHRPTCTTGLTRSQAVKAIPALANPIHWAVSLFPSSPGTAHCCMCLYVIAEHFIFWLNFCRAVEYSDVSSCSVQIKDWGWTSWKWRICVPSQSVFPSGMCSNCL